MDIFTYTPGGAETIDGFNKRLADYASKYNIIGVTSTIIASTLLLSLTLDTDMPGLPRAIRPFVAIVGADNMARLETDLDTILQQIKDADKPDENEMSIPLEIRGIDAPHPATGQVGYALYLIEVAELESEAD